MNPTNAKREREPVLRDGDEPRVLDAKRWKLDADLGTWDVVFHVRKRDGEGAGR